MFEGTPEKQADTTQPPAAMLKEVVHRIAGSDMVIQTYADGTVRVNGDVVTPANQITLEPDAGSRT